MSISPNLYYFFLLFKTTLINKALHIYTAAEEAPDVPLYPHLEHTPGTQTQELYLATCRHLNVAPCTCFYKSLTRDTIVLKRQRLGPVGVKACAVALAVGSLPTPSFTKFDFFADFITLTSTFPSMC